MNKKKYLSYQYNDYGYLVCNKQGLLYYLRMNSFEAIIIGNDELVSISTDEINVLWTRGHSIRAHLNRYEEGFISEVMFAAGLYNQLSKIKEFSSFPFTSYNELKNQKGIIRIRCDIFEQMQQICTPSSTRRTVHSAAR